MISRATATGPSINMVLLADKAQRGPLTYAEQNVVMANAAQIYSSSFGPSPSDMRLEPMPLPENVKGILASFSL